MGHRLLFGIPPVPCRGMSERAARAIHHLGLHPKIPLLGSVTLFSVRRESNFFLMGSIAGFPRDFSKGCKVTPVRPDPRADLKRSRVRKQLNQYLFRTLGTPRRLLGETGQSKAKNHAPKSSSTSPTKVLIYSLFPDIHQQLPKRDAHRARRNNIANDRSSMFQTIICITHLLTLALSCWPGSPG
jgi:hypothetical protein